MPVWNPWHGCHKISAGCQNCYVYRRDSSIGKDASVVYKTKDFDLPIRKNKQMVYELLPEGGVLYACMTSDFFLEDADGWREDCWKMIRRRQDIHFVIITKRIHRFAQCIPVDWGDGYPNVTICCTCENQERADYRLPIFLSLPIRYRNVIHEPMLGAVEIGKYLASGRIDKVICGGESGDNARMCDYNWILSVREQCVENNVSFSFKQTGALFCKDGKTYRIPRAAQQLQAAKAGIDFEPRRSSETHEQWLQRDLFQRISESRFRARFRLKEADRKYVSEKGKQTIRKHAEAFIAERLAPAQIQNDGKQTPMRGHPVFLAQHACACCCRGCLEKWHGIPSGRALTDSEQNYIADVLMEWIDRQMNEQETKSFLDEAQ